MVRLLLGRFPSLFVVVCVLKVAFGLIASRQRDRRLVVTFSVRCNLVA